jgi:hypothetical protein
MHIITIACAPVALQFVFKTKEAAEAAWSTRADEAGRIIITDDFGQKGCFVADKISCFVIEDCDLSKRAHVERSLHQQRMQADLQRAVEADSTLRAGMRSPGVITPFGMNGRGN